MVVNSWQRSSPGAIEDVLLYTVLVYVKSVENHSFHVCVMWKWRGHREERDLELNEREREGGDQHGGAIGHETRSGIVGDDLNKMELTT
ncbi:hypothetical protein TNCV_1498141 [Trichonephila clavipes]|nr:hypothetical protein TNCV_1498141 [Trichonephila clavipes]